MTAGPLIFGNLTVEHYEDSFHAANPIIDQLRDRMEVVEDERYTREYLEDDKRSIANAIQVFFSDGSSVTGYTACAGISRCLKAQRCRNLWGVLLPERHYMGS